MCIRDSHHIYMVGRYRQGQHTLVTLRSQGQSQGHQGHYHFWPILRVFAISSYSFDSRAMKMHRHVLWNHTQRSHAAEFRIFAFKVRYRAFNFKPRNGHLTALMTSDHHHIYMVGRYRQGQHTLVTLRSQGQSQGHQSHFRFLADFTRFSYLLLQFW